MMHGFKTEVGAQGPVHEDKKEKHTMVQGASTFSAKVAMERCLRNCCMNDCYMMDSSASRAGYMSSSQGFDSSSVRTELHVLISLVPLKQWLPHSKHFMKNTV